MGWKGGGADVGTNLIDGHFTIIYIYCKRSLCRRRHQPDRRTRDSENWQPLCASCRRRHQPDRRTHHIPIHHPPQRRADVGTNLIDGHHGRISGKSLERRADVGTNLIDGHLCYSIKEVPIFKCRRRHQPDRRTPFLRFFTRRCCGCRRRHQPDRRTLFGDVVGVARAECRRRHQPDRRTPVPGRETHAGEGVPTSAPT